MKTEILAPTPDNIKKAAKALKNNELVSFATETVYGLAAPLFQEESVRKIFTLKNRPSDNPLIVHINDIKWVEELAQNIPKEFYLLSEVFFPGPLTIILEKRPHIPEVATGAKPTIAIRMPGLQAALDLIAAAEEPLVAPSANISGRPSPTLAEHVFEDFNGKIPFILDCGPCQHGIESTVIYLSDSPILLRPGAISKESLEIVLKREVKSSHLAIAPGMKYRHYAPSAKVKVFFSLSELLEYADKSSKKQIVLSTQKIPSILSWPLNRQTLFANFRKADSLYFEEILIFCDEMAKEDLALMNRVNKASSNI
ncbi:MAG: threonylcarbamoyl-AMP synthase [Chlamydiae bacterium CG10_big_fil_rev_8_21_14_0_10_35_9]|nr:MAG: threonylcarbamoyl-AMP synthase [Chlamydiae bacterium CG10_big_fil_rev_8_21_14_0_10_35_9]